MTDIEFKNSFFWSTFLILRESAVKPMGRAYLRPPHGFSEILEFVDYFK